MKIESLADIKAESLATSTGAGGMGSSGEQSNAPGNARLSTAPSGGLPLFDRDAEARAWAEVPAAIGSILGLALPELAEVYTEAACLEWGKKMTALAEKRGWTAAIVGPYVGLVVASIPLVVPTYVAIKVRRMTPEQRADVEAAQRKMAEAARAAAAPNVTTPAPEKKDEAAKPAKVAPVE